jgi:3-oxoacyl-[acyl-carrier protein] reductase
MKKHLKPNQNEKVAIITGGANQIGKACAARLAEKDYKIVLADKNLQNKESKFFKVDGNKQNYAYEKVNIFKRDQVDALMGRIFRTFGRLDILVNNPVFDITCNLNRKEWDSQINKTLKGQLNCAQIAGRYMTKNKYGKIINLSMLTRLKGVDDVYCSIAEAGIAGMTRFLAQKLGRHNIHVNALALGAIDSHSLKEVASEEIINQIVKACPLKRIGQIQDVANAVLFLASDESTFITGNVLHVSGGIT